MKNIGNGTITYAVLQRLVERAWDEEDQQRLYAMSKAIDAYAVQNLEEELAAEQAV